MQNHLLNAIRSSCSSAPARYIDHQEHHDPNGVNKMPIPSDKLDASAKLFSKLPAHRYTKDDQHGHDANRHVQAVKADQRVVCCAEQIPAYRQLVVGIETS